MPRVLLSSSDQYDLCFSAKLQLNCSWRDLARYLEVNPSTFENWYRGFRLMPEDIFEKLEGISGIKVNNIKILPDNWGEVKGGQKRVELYGKFFGTLEGRKRGGSKANQSRIKEFTLPIFSNDLAEFVGIMLGDGGISRTQISITLGYSTDKEYVPYVTNLITKIFGAKFSLYRPQVKDVIRIRVSGVNLVKNLIIIGLIEGNKIYQQVDIPDWIFKEQSYMKACIRGMIDTDGCVHRKVRREKNGFEYRSVGITFCSYSMALQSSIIRLFANLGFKVAQSGTTIYLCGKEQITRYVQEIGFSNPKHFIRYRTFLKEYGWKKVLSENCFSLSATV